MPGVFIASTSVPIQVDIDPSEEGSDFSKYQEQKDPDLDSNSLDMPLAGPLLTSFLSEKSDLLILTMQEEAMADTLKGHQTPISFPNSTTSGERPPISPRPGQVISPSNPRRTCNPPSLLNPSVLTVADSLEVTLIATLLYQNPLPPFNLDSDKEPLEPTPKSEHSEDILIPTPTEEAMTEQLAQVTSTVNVNDPFFGLTPTVAQLTQWYKTTYNRPGSICRPFPPPLKGKAKALDHED
ncbi:hypothetical protein J3A83DRAFT_4367329 [Scleroderma citrinum]